VKTALPQRPLFHVFLIDGLSAAGLYSANDLRKRTALQLHQPMEMVRHHHPRNGLYAALVMCLAKLCHQQSACLPIGEDGLALVND
jgi:hypothetical protein